MEHLQDKIAVVTGAASGIGLGITRALIAEGVRVAMLDVDSAALEAAAASVARSGVEVRHFVVDVTHREQMQHTAEAIERHFGKVHILCNNAGVATGGAVEELSYAIWDWALDVNLRGVVNGMQTFLPLIIGHGEGGHIVNTSSILGQMAIAGQAVYCASKYAILGISEAARLDLAPKNIGVSALCPGLIATNIVKSVAERPLSLGGGGGMSDELNKIHQMYQTKGLSADTVGLRVVQAIEANELYIFADTGQAAGIRARFQNILASLARAEALEKGRNS